MASRTKENVQIEQLLNMLAQAGYEVKAPADKASASKQEGKRKQVSFYDMETIPGKNEQAPSAGVYITLDPDKADKVASGYALPVYITFDAAKTYGETSGGKTGVATSKGAKYLQAGIDTVGVSVNAFII